MNTGPYFEERAGLRWQVVQLGSDGITRSLGKGFRCWRWINAVRLADALNIAYRDGYDYEPPGPPPKRKN